MIRHVGSKNLAAFLALTLVLVGSSTTRRVTTGQGLWVYTPRGYGDRAAERREAAG